MHNFKDLKVWQKSIELVKEVYKNVSDFPEDEKYGLTSQLKRCAVSIPSNISEGAGRTTNKDFNKFLSMSLGSSFELETQLIIAKELSLINEAEFNLIKSKVTQVQKMLNGLKYSLAQKN